MIALTAAVALGTHHLHHRCNAIAYSLTVGRSHYRTRSMRMEGSLLPAVHQAATQPYVPLCTCNHMRIRTHTSTCLHTKYAHVYTDAHPRTCTPTCNPFHITYPPTNHLMFRVHAQLRREMDKLKQRLRRGKCTLVQSNTALNSARERLLRATAEKQQLAENEKSLVTANSPSQPCSSKP